MLPSLPQDPFPPFPFLILPLFPVSVFLPAFCCGVVEGCSSLKPLSQAAVQLSENTRKTVCVLISGARTQTSMQQCRAGASALACNTPTVGNTLLKRVDLDLEICCASIVFCWQFLR